METMTAEQVCNYLETSRIMLTRWNASGLLKPMANGEYDAAKVKAFKKPVKGHRKASPRDSINKLRRR